MVDQVKMLISEKNGQELLYNEEHVYSATTQPFDQTGTTVLADNTRGAILEVAGNSGQSRFSIIMGYSANANSGRWLEVFGGISSDTTPYVISENCALVSLSVSNKNSALNATFTIYRNNIAIATIYVGETSGSNKYGTSILPIPILLYPADVLSVKQTASPSTKAPIVSLNIKVLY